MSNEIKRTFIIDALFIMLLLFYLLSHYENPFVFLRGINTGMTEIEQVMWVMLFAPVWGTGFYIIEKNFELIPLTLYRYRSRVKWWNIVELIIMVHTIAVYAVTGIVLYIIKPEYFQLNVIILIAVHGLFLMQIGALSRLILKKSIMTACIIILFECAASELALKYVSKIRYLIPCWGMYGFSNKILKNTGFSVRAVIIAQLCVVVFFYLIMFAYSKHFYRGNYNENND